MSTKPGTTVPSGKSLSTGPGGAPAPQARTRPPEVANHPGRPISPSRTVPSKTIVPARIRGMCSPVATVFPEVAYLLELAPLRLRRIPVDHGEGDHRERPEYGESSRAAKRMQHGQKG